MPGLRTKIKYLFLLCCHYLYPGAAMGAAPIQTSCGAVDYYIPPPSLLNHPPKGSHRRLTLLSATLGSEPSQKKPAAFMDVPVPERVALFQLLRSSPGTILDFSLSHTYFQSVSKTYWCCIPNISKGQQLLPPPPAHTWSWPHHPLPESCSPFSLVPQFSPLSLPLLCPLYSGQREFVNIYSGHIPL